MQRHNDSCTSTLVLALVAAALPLSALAGEAPEDGRFYGMLRSRDLTPFGFLRLDMRPAHAVAIEPHTFAFEAELGYQNTWALSRNVEKYLTDLEASGPRREIGPAEVQAIRDLPGENYLLDLESATLDLTMHYKISSQWTVYAIATAVSYHGGFLDSGIEKFHETFGFSTWLFLSQIISFCIVCALLYRFAYKPVLTMLEQRRQTIKEGLANAEKNKVELARTEAQRLEVMAQANAQATKMIEEARAAAARVEQRETQKAIAAAEQIVVKAQEAAVQEHARMLAQLKQELGRLVVQTTATVTGKILTPEDQKRMAAETTVQITAG